MEPVLSLGEALRDPQTLARQMVIECDVPEGGRAKQVASPIRFSASKQDYCRGTVAKGVGAHTGEVLRELDYSDDQIDRLKQTGAFN